MSWRAFVNRWRAPLIAGTLSLVLLTLGFVVLLPSLKQHTGPQAPTPEREVLLKQLEEGTRALKAGRFNVAFRELNQARLLRDQNPRLLPVEQSRDLNQMHRQAQLLAGLSTSSLQEILRRASQVRDSEEWEVVFREYRGKAIVFDERIIRDFRGDPAFEVFEVEVNNEVARLALDELTLFRKLPLLGPQRLIFGARLARCGREPGGGWAIHFEPDSAVLLTDPEVVEHIVELNDEVLEVLARQRNWIYDLGEVNFR